MITTTLITHSTDIELSTDLRSQLIITRSNSSSTSIDQRTRIERSNGSKIETKQRSKSIEDQTINDEHNTRTAHVSSPCAPHHVCTYGTPCIRVHGAGHARVPMGCAIHASLRPTPITEVARSITSRSPRREDRSEIFDHQLFKIAISRFQDREKIQPRGRKTVTFARRV